MLDKPVLVVRPLRNQDAFLKLLDQASIAYRHIPIMEIQPVLEGSGEYQIAESLVDKLDQFDQAIFISANAVEIGLPMIAKRWPKMPSNLEFFAVGQQTADIFAEYNCRVCCPELQPNTEGLLQELPQLKTPKGKSVLIFRGGQGRQTLGEELIQRGATVAYCELYRRIIQPAQLAEAQAMMPNVACLVAHSGELLQAMDIPGNKRVPLVVPSARIADLAQKMGYERIQVAKNALPTSMFDAVLQSICGG
jgi:uroporphyrinogen-III synthase